MVAFGRVVLLASLLLGASCAPAGAPANRSAAGTAAGASTAPAAAPAAAPTTVRIGMPTIDLSNLPLTIGIWKGYFEAENLNVELLRVGGQAALPALLNGEVDYLFGWGAASSGIAQDVPMRVLAILLDRPPHVVVARAGIHGPADLRGGRLAMSRAGGSDEAVITRALAKVGLRLEDVEAVRLGETSARYGALAAGQVDAATLIQPFTAQAEAQGMQVIARGADLLQTPLGIVATTQAQLDARPDVAPRLLRGVVRGLDFLQDPANRAEIVALTVARTDLDPATAPLLVEETLQIVSQTGEVPDAVLEEAIAGVRARAGRSDPLPLAKVVDYSLLHEARQAVAAR